MIAFIVPQRKRGLAVPKRVHATVGLVRYLFGPGKHNEHSNQRVIAAADTLGIADGTRLRHVEDREEIIALGQGLDSHRKAMGVEMPGGHVWHCAISNPAGDRELSDSEWAQVARAAVDRMGFTESSGHAPCRWLAVHHGRSVNGNDHIHLVANLVREDGTHASIWNDRRTMSRVCRDFEERFGLRVVEGRAGAGMPGLSRAEIERAGRAARDRGPGGGEPDRERLARIVRGCAVAASDEADFVRLVRRSGVMCRPRYGPGRRSEVVGYSVALKPSRGGGRPVWFGGGRLGRDLTLPRLREHWDSASGDDQAALAEWSSGNTSPRPSRGYASQTWEQAATVVASVRERLAAVPLDDAAAWAGAAREAAGILCAWSARLEPDRPGPLAGAAAALARSAQTRFDQPHAYRHPAVRDLRGVCMVVFAASRDSRGVAGEVMLLRQLTRLMEAIHAMHVARGQAQQAAAVADAARNRLASLHASTSTPIAPISGPGLTPPAPARPGPYQSRGDHERGR